MRRYFQRRCEYSADLRPPCRPIAPKDNIGRPFGGRTSANTARRRGKAARHAKAAANVAAPGSQKRLPKWRPKLAVEGSTKPFF